MSNIAIALALILATETPSMDTSAIGDTHLPPSRRAYGRYQIRKPVIDDLNSLYKLKGLAKFTRADSMSVSIDTMLARRWLVMQCGDNASVKEYLTTWNGGKQGKVTKDAQNYYRKAKRKHGTDYFYTCYAEVMRAGVR